MKIFLILFILISFLTIVNCEYSKSDEVQLSNLKIAYNVLIDEENADYEIFTMNLDGSGKQNISNSKSIDWVYYTFEDKIYFVSDRDTTRRKFLLYKMNSDGSNVKRISRFVLDDSWITSRKNGSELVVSSSKDGNRHELYLIDSTGAELRRLTENEFYDNDPCFSPDGEQLVFRSRRPKTDELYIMDLDGQNLQQLTYYPKTDSSAGEYGYHAGPPFWEPNSNRISFASRRNNNYSIFTINPDGSDLRQLTPGAQDEVWHSWSPDGTQLVFDGADKGDNYDIYIMDSDGANLARLTDDEQYEQAPVFFTAFNLNEVGTNTAEAK